jgi:excisionase family DNA binding protein
LLSGEAQAAFLDLIDERIAERLARFEREAPRFSPWFTVDRAAEYLDTSPDAIRKRIERGQLPFHRPEGSPIMLHRDEIDATYGPLSAEVLR